MYAARDTLTIGASIGLRAAGVGVEFDRIDVAIVGAGVVGCAIAARLASHRRRCFVLERETHEGTGVTSRNSGVIHSGLYYPPASVKASTCIRGQELLYAWCSQHRVAHRRTGKLIIARSQAEEAALAELLANANQSGARDLEWISPAMVARMQPELGQVQAAIWSPNSGIVDVHGLTRSLRTRAEQNGAVVVCQAQVVGLEPRQDDVVVHTSRGSVAAAQVINAAGLQADDVARMVNLHDYTIYPCRGDYYWCRGPTIERLIYPVRASNDPGLGIHLTPDLGGQLRVGPDARYVDRKDDFRPMHDRQAAFEQATRRLLGPQVQFSLHYEGCGIRPKLRGPQQSGFADFVLRAFPDRVLHLLGIESPGLTAALALAERVEDWVRKTE